MIVLQEELNQEGNLREVARLAILGLPYAGAWLDAVPIAALGLYLQPREFIMATKYCLGIPVYDREALAQLATGRATSWVATPYSVDTKRSKSVAITDSETPSTTSLPQLPSDP